MNSTAFEWVALRAAGLREYWTQSMNRKQIAVIAVVPASGEKGGAERFHYGLVEALNRYGAEADLVEVISDE